MSNVAVAKSGPKHPWYDDSLAPIICMHFPDTFSDDELLSALTAVKAWLLNEVNGVFAFIVDSRKPLSINAKQRSMLAEVEKSYAHVDKQFNAGQAVVVPGSVARGIFTAVYWMSPPVYPVRIVATMDEALKWLRPHLEQAIAQFPDGKIWQRDKKSHAG